MNSRTHIGKIEERRWPEYFITMDVQALYGGDQVEGVREKYWRMLLAFQRDEGWSIWVPCEPIPLKARHVRYRRLAYAGAATARWGTSKAMDWFCRWNAVGEKNLSWRQAAGTF